MDLRNPSIDELRAEIRRIWRTRLGSQGRITFSVGMEDGEPCWVSHWIRTGSTGYEDCRAVGMGSVAECLAALERYADRFVVKPRTEAEIAATLGVTAPAMLAAE